MRPFPLLLLPLAAGCALFRPDAPVAESAVPPPSAAPAAVIPDPYQDAFRPVPQYVYLPSPTSEAERAVLARLEQELTVLERLATEAQARAQPESRLRFRYDLLARDLEQIRAGVREWLQGPNVEPRQFPPLRGNYRG